VFEIGRLSIRSAAGESNAHLVCNRRNGARDMLRPSDFAKKILFVPDCVSA
jgi:hypothetical protein